MRTLRTFCRWLRGRCVSCGKVKPYHGAGCIHCIRDPRRCHSCNKNRTFMLMYGASRRTIDLLSSS
jgi:hypothetical protein